MAGQKADVGGSPYPAKSEFMSCSNVRCFGARRYSVDLNVAKHAGDNSVTFPLRQLTMRRLPGRTPLQKSSSSLLHSRAILTGSVKRFLAKTH
jgi:hypothetical protein